jgi:phospholipid/cholesterol/gamma-HCH transport system ATP-binding protein
MIEPLIRVVDVHKRFGDQVVYAGLDLEVYPRETLVLLGRSGSGKSVFLRMLLGLLRPDRGQIWFDGQDVARLSEKQLRPIRRRVGMVFQGSALFDSLTVEENVAYGLAESLRWPADRIAARVAECLHLVDLQGTERLLPESLSGGMRKRVAIARAVAPEPEVVLYDEPTTGLDPATARRIQRLIRRLAERLGVTSLVITHDLAFAFSVADRVAVLGDGRLAWAGPTAAARRYPRPPALARFLGEGGEPEWSHPVDSP